MRAIGRRAQFFFLMAIVSLALVWPTLPTFRWVAWLCVALAFVWGVLFAIEDLAAPLPPSNGAPVSGKDGLFAPPPPPRQRRSG